MLHIDFIIRVGQMKKTRPFLVSVITPSFHGHNYELIVKVTGEPDPETGYVCDMKILSDLIKEHVSDRFDHKNLNMDVPEFKELNPTAENIAVVIYNILRAKVDAKLELNIRLYETERNFVEYPA
ncbi:MAG: hypothetical protein Roseis3KO_53350 [Roseivirga sp.]